MKTYLKQKQILLFKTLNRVKFLIIFHVLIHFNKLFDINGHNISCSQEIIKTQRNKIKDKFKINKFKIKIRTLNKIYQLIRKLIKLLIINQ